MEDLSLKGGKNDLFTEVFGPERNYVKLEGLKRNFFLNNMQPSMFSSSPQLKAYQTQTTKH